MEKTKTVAIRSLIFLPAFLWTFLSLGEAATIQVDCSAASLQAAVEKAKPGDTFLVSGTCKQNLFINEEVARITLDGQGKATINGPDTSKPTIRVRGRGITIKGFTVTGVIGVLWGGRAVIDGNTVQQGEILVSSGSSAMIANNTVQNSKSYGIRVGDNSFAKITNNTIKNSRRHGIAIVSNSAAWVGVLQSSDKTPSPNIVENNGMHGIVVTRSSAVRMVGNTIRNNKSDGIHAMRGAVVHISSNTIDANGRDGIRVAANSHISMRSGGSKIFRAPNSTTSNNGGFGISCTSNSHVEGSLGSLNGNKGAKAIDPSCVASLKPGGET